MKSFKRLLNDDSGATAIEYALIAVLVGIVGVGAWTSIGGNLAMAFGAVADAFPAVSG